MSLENIKDVISYYERHVSPGSFGEAIVRAAREEVEAIERACRTLEAESIGDRVYDVRDRAAEDRSFTGNRWEHPRVVAYGEAAQVITNIAKESTK